MTTGSVHFVTSGTTGGPVEWIRTREQLHAEVELIVDLLLGVPDRVACFAPPHHVYGRLYGRVLPQRYGIPVVDCWRNPLAAPPPAGDGRVLLVCIPSTWHVLQRCASWWKQSDEVVVLHSTAPPPPVAHRVVTAQQSTGLRTVELLGSTETGAVAHRNIAAAGQHAAAWQLLPDVLADLPADADTPLVVGGPRLARRAGSDLPPDRVTMPDVVRMASPRRFVRLGRATELVKINGKRLWLPDVEDAVRTGLHSAGQPDADVVAIPVDDDLRGENYELFYAGVGPGILEPTVRALVRSAGHRTPMPRSLHRVATIPRSATGKVVRDRLLTMRGRRRG